MKEKKPLLRRISLSGKVVILMVLSILMVILLFISIYQRRERMKQQNSQNVENHIDSETGNEKESNLQRSSLSQKESSDQTENSVVKDDKDHVAISNLKELAKPILKDQTHLLEEALYDYNLNQGIIAKTATLLEAAVSLKDFRVTEFYLENSDGSLVTIQWHPASQTMTAALCQFTKEEIENAVWLHYLEEPDEHGISLEEELEFQETLNNIRSETAIIKSEE